ncbi:MAG: phospholipid carrier-dependent glycosyltransferase [Planctomycetes bacterium]|nr:phospholipid carrier-dependent glycosyltransferase [Planctomycetota bacterium]
MSAGRPYPTSRPGWFAAWLLFAFVLVSGVVGVSMRDSWGWDEATHAELPAARMLLAAQAGRWDEASDVLLDCQQYPPAYPVLLASVQSMTGVSELACRRTGRVLGALAVLGAWLLAVELLRQRRIEAARRGEPLSPSDGWSAREQLAALLPPVLLALSPLFLHYSGTLFLEVPFACVSLYTLRAWLQRAGDGVRADGGLARELLAGAGIALCVFTKWNYGLLLGAGLAAAWLLEAFGELRAGRAARFGARSLCLAAVPALAFLWWFVLPLPRGGELAALHRASFLAFLQGNQDASMVTPWARRALDWGVAFLAGPRALLLAAVGLALVLPWGLRGATRALLLVLLASALPVALHPFHLDRFLVPQLALLVVPAGLGLSRLAPGRRFGVAVVFTALGAFAVVARTAEHPLLLRWSGIENAEPVKRAYQLETLFEAASLSPDRRLLTAGIERGVHDALLEALARDAGASARVGWLGVHPEFPPAAIHLGLLARGGSAERFRRDAGRARADGKPDMLITHEFVDPGWNDEQIRGWARAFDVVYVTQPMNWKGRAAKEVLARYRDTLLAGGEWKPTELARVEVAKPLEAPVPVELYALRRKR